MLPFIVAIWYTVFPFLRGVRAPTRFQYVFYVPFSFCVGYGLLYLQRFRHFKVVFFLLLVLFVLENLQIYPYAATSLSFREYSRDSDYVRLLSGQITAHSPMLYLDQRASGRYLNMSTLTGEKTMSGYSGYYPEDWGRIAGLLDNNYDDLSLKRLQALGVRYLVVHTDLLGDIQRPVFEKRFDERLQESLVFSDSHVKVFDLPRLNLSVQICSESAIRKVSAIGTRVIVENTQDCFFVAPYSKRYDNGLNVRLPLVIAPYEKHMLDQI
jgi:hypothetical protein